MLNKLQVVVVLAGSLAVAGAASAQTPAQVEKGMQVYAAQKCSICHAIAGKGNAKGPLDGVGTKLSADEIHQWIVDAPGMTAKTKAPRKPVMKAYASLSKEDMAALVAYLQSLKK
ncbi:MAG: cytochrome c [Acidimicrobiia bacterium]|nr:cytochrome c [Acidimicrobiia bacterium]